MSIVISYFEVFFGLVGGVMVGILRNIGIPIRDGNEIVAGILTFIIIGALMLLLYKLNKSSQYKKK